MIVMTMIMGSPRKWGHGCLDALLIIDFGTCTWTKIFNKFTLHNYYTIIMGSPGRWGILAALFPH